MAQPSPNAFNTVSRQGRFEDLIILFWDEEQQTEYDFWEFVDSDKITESRYYHYYDQQLEKYILTLKIVDGIPLAESEIAEWAKIPKSGCAPDGTPPPNLCIYLGFQRDWYTRRDFFDILSWSDKIPTLLGFPVQVHWLPNDWFDSPGMLPTLTSGDNALEWMESQIRHSKPDIITYDYKGAHLNYDKPPI